jgi:uncharacterized membrane protein
MRLLRLFKRDIAHESRTWVEKGIITEDQAKSICNEYEVDYGHQSDHAHAYGVLVTLGYAFIGLAVITLLGANWDEIPRGLRMWGLIGTTMFIHAIGCLSLREGNESKATRLFLLGNFAYGASIILIAQTYHLGEHMPDGIFWWAIGSLPFGLLLKSVSLTLFSLILAIIWFFVESGMGFYPTLFPIFLLGALWVLSQGAKSLLLFLATIGSIGLWIEYSLAHLWRDGLQYHFEAEHVVVSSVLFCLVYTIGHKLSQSVTVIGKDYGALLNLWCLRFAFIVMIFLSFEGPWEELIEAKWENLFSMTIIAGLFGALALVLARQVDRFAIVGGWLCAIIISCFVVINSSESDAIYLQIATNLVMVAFGVGLILRGISNGISHYFYLGVFAILITAFMRYVDLVGNYLGGAILFLLFAGILIGAAKFWQHKMSLVKQSGGDQ